MRSFFNFIKYNNAFPIILSVVILVTGAAYAAIPNLRQAVFSPSAENFAPVVPKKTDTAKLLSTDTEEFDLALRIDAITEDVDAYHVTYSYTTLEVAAGEWRKARKNGKMDVFKAMLGKRDLKTYFVEQLGQVIDREIAYLSEAQSAARSVASAKTSGKYASLVGTEIDVKSREESKKNDVSGDSSVNGSKENGSREEEENVSASSIGLTKEEINAMVVKAVSDFLAIDMNMPEPLSEVVSTEPAVQVVEAVPEIKETVTEETAPESEIKP